MKVVRFTVDGRTRLGAVTGDEVADLSLVDPTLPTDVGEALAAGLLPGLDRLAGRAPRRPLDEVRLEAPMARPPAFLAVGLNYRAHADESGVSAPEVPVIFNKAITCVTGPHDPIVIPAAAPGQVDYEGELGVVIGTRCRAVPAEEALEVVAGYFVVDDVSVRDWQFATSTWTMGKGWDTHGPIGPWLTTTDELPDPQGLRVRTWVDGELRQDASTANMIFDCRHLIAHVSTACTLLPGTIIATALQAVSASAWTRPGSCNPAHGCGSRSTASAPSTTPSSPNPSDPSLLGVDGVDGDDRDDGRHLPDQAHLAAAAVALDHVADVDALHPGGAQDVVGLEDVVGVHDGDHADAEVEHLGHLVVGDAAESLDLTEDPGHFPRAELHDGVATPGQDPGQVGRQAAAGDVGPRPDRHRSAQRHQGGCVDH